MSISVPFVIAGLVGSYLLKKCPNRPESKQSLAGEIFDSESDSAEVHT